MRMFNVRSILFLTLFLTVAGPLMALKRYWVGNGTNRNWNTTTNWSATSGGSSGASVPGTNDTAYFNSAGLGHCALDVAVSIKRLEILSGFTDSLVQNKKTITLGNGFNQTGGTFWGDSTNITVSGVFTLTGGTFRSTKSTLTLQGNFTADVTVGTFSHNNGKALFNSTCTIAGPGNINFYQLEMQGQTSQKTITVTASTLTVTVTNSFTESGNAGIIINTGTICAQGDINLNTNAVADAGSATILINGTGNQSINGGSQLFSSGRIQNVIINKSSGNLSFFNYINFIGNVTYTAGTIVPGTSTAHFFGAKTITGSMSLYNVTFSNSTAATTITLASTTTITVTNTLEFNGQSGTGFFLTVSGGTVNAQGNITDNCPVINGGGGTTNIVINGTGNQTLTGSGSDNGHELPSVTINKSSGTLTLVDTIPTAGNWTYSAGTVNAGSSNLVIVGTKTVTGTQTLNDLTFYYGSIGGNIVTLASGTVLTLNGDLVYHGLSPGLLSVNTGTILISGDLNLQNAFSNNFGGGGSALLKINGTGNQTIYGNNSAYGTLCNIEINKTSGTLFFNSKFRIVGNWTYTAGTIDPGTSTVAFFDGMVATGSMTFYNLNISGGTTSSTFTISTGTNLTVTNQLTLSGLTQTVGAVLNGGSISVQGTLQLPRMRLGGGTTNVLLTGSSNQTIFGKTSSGTDVSQLPNLIIDKAGGDVILDSNVFVKRFTLRGTSNYRLRGTNGGNFLVSGDSVTMASSCKANGGDATILINGSSIAQRLSGSGIGRLPKLKISKSGTQALTISGTINVGNDWTYTAGTLSVSGSTVNFDTSLTISGTHTLNNVSFSPSASSTVAITSGTTLTIPGTLTYAGTAGLVVNTGTINAKGNITVTNTVTTGGGGTALLNINGTAGQTLTGLTAYNGGLPLSNLVINKSADTLKIVNCVTAGGNWTYTAGTIRTTGSTVMFNPLLNKQTITGTHTLNKVRFSNPNSSSTRDTIIIASTSTLTVNDSLLVTGTGPIKLDSGVVKTLGHINITNSATGNVFGNGTLLVNGTGSQTLKSSTTSPFVPNFTINKSSGTLSITGASLPVGGNFTHSSGTVSVDTSNTVQLYNTFSINASPITFGSIDVKAGTRSISSDLNIYKDLQISSGAKLAAVGTSYNISLQGNWNNISGGGSYGFGSGTGNVIFTGSKNQSITEPGGNNDTLAKVKMNKSAGTLSLYSIVNVSDSLKLIAGKIVSDTTNLLVLKSRAVSSNMSSSSFVSGAVKKIGNSAFTFPVGKSSTYQPLSISAPSSSTDAYIAEYFNSGQTYGSAVGDSINGISNCEYWKLNRKAGSSTISATGGWNSSSCSIDTNINMRLSNWDGTQWKNLGGISPTGNRTAGTITSLPISLSTLLQGHFIPIALVKLCKISLTISSSVPSDTLCQGDTLILTGNPGGITFFPISSYTWTNSNNTSTASTQTLAVNNTGTYYLTAANTIGCSVKDSESVFVQATAVTVNSDSIFIGETATLSATGATTYTWTPSTALNATTGATVLANPVVTIVYTVTGTTYGCPGVATSTVTVVPDTVPSFAGQSCYCTSSFAPYSGKKYIISAWAREDNAAPTKTNFDRPEIYLDFGDFNANYLSSAGAFKPSGKIIDGWQRIEGTFITPVGASYIIIRLQSTSGDVLFDDIRVYPEDGSVKSYVYDPVTMRLVAELDERNYATEYEYDEEGKLTRVKKETERGTMTIKESRNSSPKQ